MKKMFAGTLAVAVISAALPAMAGSGVKSDSASYYLELGRTQVAARKYSDAWRYLEKAGQYDPQNASIQKELAAVCFKMNRMAPAIRALEAAVAIDPNDKATRLDLLKRYFDYGQWEQTIASGMKLRKEMPGEKDMDWMLGKAQYMLQDYGKAITHLQVAVKEDPKNAEAN